MIEMHMRADRAFAPRASFLLFACTVVAGLALLASEPARAQSGIDPCETYQVYADAGSGESGIAVGLKRICDRIGPVALTRSCLAYYTRVTADYSVPLAEEKAEADRLAEACEASMPGGTSLPVCGDGVDCAQSGAKSDDIRHVLPASNPVADAEPVLADAECGDGLECLPVSDDMIAELTPDENARVTAADPPPVSEATDPEPVDPEKTALAADLAFWQAIADSDDPTLFQAYLERFPDGIFTPIAQARIEAAREAPAPETVEAEPAQTAETRVVEPVSVVDPEKTPRQLHEEALDIMSRAYEGDEATWEEEARRAIPLFQMAAKGGWAPAYIALGDFAETGIGMTANTDNALDSYLKAGRLGDLLGYERALMLLDQTNNASAYVETFLTFYRIDPDWALEALASTGTGGPIEVQRYLRDQGYYTGALDGEFGPESRTALYALINGKPPAVASGASVAKTSEPAPDPLPPADGLAVELQMALQRVGCYVDEVDGRWGPASENAMSVFNLWRGTHHPIDQPSVAALNDVSRTPGPVCGVD